MQQRTGRYINDDAGSNTPGVFAEGQEEKMVPEGTVFSSREIQNSREGKTEILSDGIRFAAQEDIPELADMMALAWQQIEQKEWYMPDDAQGLEAAIKETGYILVCEEEQEIAGFLMMIRPGDDDVYTRYVEGADGSNSIHSDTCVVKKEFRGRGIQKRLFREAEKIERMAGTKYMLCTIHPDNKASLKSALAAGYEIAHTSNTVYDNGFLRHVMVRRL